MFDMEYIVNDIFSIGVAFFLLAYLLAMAGYTIRRQARLKEDMKRKKYTVEFCMNDETNYDGFINDVMFIQDYERHDRNDLNHNTASFLQKLNIIFDKFEKISIGVQAEVFDEEIIRTYYEKYFRICYNIYKYPILEARNSTRNPSMFIEYEKLVHKWEENRMKERGNG